MSTDLVELLFFDTFAHDNTEEINLDLVQFPKPVYVTEVRIIPLGARVQADFPGGVRLGATNPSQFQIEFFVNDLGKPGASTFESLGGFEYNQNGCINLECAPDETVRKIPTDGLVLRGWYTTITLAVYGTLTNNLAEQIIQPVVNPTIPQQPASIVDTQQIIPTAPIENEWAPQETIPPVPVEYTAQNTTPYQQPYPQPETYNPDYPEYYGDLPKDPRNYHHTPENTEWENKPRTRSVTKFEHERERDRERERERDRDRDRERPKDLSYQKTASLERDHSDRRDKRYTRSQSKDRDRSSRDFKESRDREHDRDWELERSDYRDRSDREWDRDRDRDNRCRDRDRTDRDRDRYKHDDNYRRSYNRDERDDRKRPRTPPMQSPKRPHTPHGDVTEPPAEDTEFKEEDASSEKQRRDKERETKEEQHSSKSPSKETKEVHTPPAEESMQMDVEEFEPILSDEDILDDGDHYQDIDYEYSAYTNNDDLIKLFTPGVTELQKYKAAPLFTIDEDKIEIEENLKTIIGITDDYFKSSITKYVLEGFDKLNTEIKEEFIHLSERLINTVGSIENFCDIMKLYTSLKVANTSKFSECDKEVLSQINTIVETIIDWLKIALDYEMANAQDQPAYKIRHIKCGIRLADYCCNSAAFLKLLWENNINIHRILLSLYDKEFMALSIKLMVLKALDTYLLHKSAIEKFLVRSNQNVPKENGFHDRVHSLQNNGYKSLVKFLRSNPSVRIKFALKSILKKLNLFDVFRKMHAILMKLKSSSDASAEEIILVSKSLDYILQLCQSGHFALSQPRRFLPVSAQFEIVRSETRDVLVEYFKMFDLLQCFVLLLAYPSTLNLPAIKTPIFEIVSELLQSPEGLDYLVDNCETVSVLLKCLLRLDEEIQYPIQDCLMIKSHNLGLKLAYKIQAVYHVECLKEIGKKHNFDCDATEVNDQLHALFCLTFSSVGKTCCSEVLGMKSNIKSLLQFFNIFHIKDKSESLLSRIKNSPGLAYIVDLIAMAVTVVPNIAMMDNYYKDIMQVIYYQELFEESVAQKLNEVKAYMIPLDGVIPLNYDNISNFVEIVNKQIDNATSYPAQLITSLRIIQYLGISFYTNNFPVICENPLSNYVELKYKHVILQLYSLDGASLIIKILQKICDNYEQPSLYSSVFVSNQGNLIMHVIYPCIELLQQMLAYVIKCRGTNFKDLTLIPVLLQTYNLLNTYPPTSPSYFTAQNTMKLIVETLLVYTQPVSEAVHEKDSLNKTLWSLMCGEVLKYTMLAPYVFTSGLLVFSELLPLPLPIQTIDDLNTNEINYALNLRKLWSAHLHPHNSMIQEIITRLCTTSQQQLLNLLRRVCVQLSDLASTSATVVMKGHLETIYEALIPKDENPLGPCSSYVARLLNFLACLVTHSTLKCAMLHLFYTGGTTGPAKTEDKYQTLLQTFGEVLKLNSPSNSHIQAQECILSIIQSFCDTEITILQNPINENKVLTSETYLANALPIKDYLVSFISMILDHLSVENSFVTYLPIVRTLLLLTEHDYGFYHLREQLIKRNDGLKLILGKLSKSFAKDNAIYLSTLNTLLEFLRVSVTLEEDVEEQLLYTSRTMKMTLNELKILIGWNTEAKEGDEEKHPLVSLEETLKKTAEEDTNFDGLVESVTNLIKLLNSETPDSDKEQTYTEPLLPSPETLLIQFSGRTVFSSSDACDERLTTNYWLSVPTEETENETETVPCDLTEISRHDLPAEFNLAREIEKLCRICPSEDIDEKEKIDEQHKAKMRKPFITPMRARGFPRTVQQRPDLFRSRPPNTSRPPSLHVDDFVALETCGAQPTGPTGYNKISRELLASTRIARGNRGRAFMASERAVQYRQLSWWGTGRLY